MDHIARNKEVKKRLAKLFGSRNISVHNGRGTAYGWCHIDIDILRPDDCTCVPGLMYSKWCDSCKKKLNLAHKTAESAIRGIEFYKYSDDMGFDNQEYNIQISFAEVKS